MIEQLISQITAKVGLPEAVAQKGVGILLGFMKKDGDDGPMGELLSKIPGADSLADQFGGAEATGGGGLMSKLSGLMGGKAAGAMGAMGALSQLKETGIDLDQAKSMMPVVKDFMTEHAGGELVDKAMASIPGIGDLLD